MGSPVVDPVLERSPSMSESLPFKKDNLSKREKEKVGNGEKILYEEGSHVQRERVFAQGIVERD